MYSCYHSRGIVAACAPGRVYLPEYWFSRYPAKVPPTWNLVNLFDTQSWILLFLSILFVSIFFFISAKIGTSHFGIPTFNEEIILSPFRQILDLQIDNNQLLGLNRKCFKFIIEVHKTLEFHYSTINNPLVCPLK